MLEVWHYSRRDGGGNDPWADQIVEPIGAGGMGEVYKALDTRLDRIVAIKVLPAHLSANPESRERLEREARAISGLNHPHICTLHDIGRQGDIDFLVMEGYVLFQRQGTVFAQAFNPKTLEASGDPLHIMDDVFTSGIGRPALAVSQNGVLLYRGRGGAAATQQFVWYDRNGRPLGPAGKPDAYAQNFDLSPDGKQIALSIRDPASGGSKLWVMDWARGVTMPFTFSATGSDVVWSPDGLRLAYGRLGAQGKGTGLDIVEKKSSGLGEEQVLVAGPAGDWVEDWSKDGQYIAYATRGVGGVGVDLWGLPLFGDRKPFAIVESPFDEDEPHFSFDTKWLAYNSSESGTSQVYVISFPAKDQKRQISDTGGAQPRWNRARTELYYLSLDGRMMAASITTGAKLDSGIPRSLFETGLSINPGQDQYAVTPDGQRFLLLKPLSEGAQTPLTVIVNWTRLLKP